MVLWKESPIAFWREVGGRRGGGIHFLRICRRPGVILLIGEREGGKDIEICR